VHEAEAPHEAVVTNEDAVTAQGVVATVILVAVGMYEVEVVNPEVPLHLRVPEAQEAPRLQEEGVGVILRKEGLDLVDSVRLEGVLRPCRCHLPSKLQKKGGQSSTSVSRQCRMEWRSFKPS